MAVLGAPVFPHGNLAFFVAIFSEVTRLPAGVGLRLHSIHPSIIRESKWRYIMKKINLRNFILMFIQVGEEVYISMINKAEKYCWFMTPYLIITDEMTHEK